MTLLIIGSGSHARIVAEAAAAAGFSLLGFGDDDASKNGALLNNLPIFSPWEHLTANAYVVAVGANEPRARIFRRIVDSGKELATIVSPRAFVSSGADIGDGTVVLPGAVVQAGARVGKDVIVNAGSVVDHDAVLGDHAHIGIRCAVASYGTVEPLEFLPHGSIRLRTT